MVRLGELESNGWGVEQPLRWLMDGGSVGHRVTGLTIWAELSVMPRARKQQQA